MTEHSKPWILYTYLTFALSWVFLIIGVLAMDVTYWQKGFFFMGCFFLVGSSISLAKTIRDMHEGQKLIKKIEDAKTEQLLTGLATDRV